MVEHHHLNRGFSLVEVLTATIVMTMMMVALMGFLQYGSDVWRRGKAQLDSANYARIVFDLIGEELFSATRIYESQPEPNPADLWPAPPSDTLVFDGASQTSTLFYIREIKGIKGGTSKACFELVLDATTNCLLRETEDDAIESGDLLDTPLASSNYATKRWGKVRFARNVMDFEVTRLSAQTVKVYIQFGIDTDADGILDLPDSEHSMVFLAPQLEN